MEGILVQATHNPYLLLPLSKIPFPQMSIDYFILHSALYSKSNLRGALLTIIIWAPHLIFHFF